MTPNEFPAAGWHWNEYSTGPIQHDPREIVIGAILLIGLIYLLRKTGWPKI